MIDGLLSLSRDMREEPSRESVDLSALAESILAEQAALEPSRRVGWSVEPGLSCQGDPRMLEAVMRNLLANAWKFTALRADAEIRFFAQRRNGSQFFSVADNGVGFDPQLAEKMFRPFERLHQQKEFPGTGIGLATVRRIIERHRGTVLAEGAPGLGATLSFTVPSRSPGES